MNKKSLEHAIGQCRLALDNSKKSSPDNVRLLSFMYLSLLNARKTQAITDEEMHFVKDKSLVADGFLTAYPDLYLQFEQLWRGPQSPSFHSTGKTCSTSVPPMMGYYDRINRDLKSGAANPHQQ